MNVSELEERRVALMLDYQRVLGHLEEVDFWLKQIEESSQPEDSVPPEPVPPAP